MSRLSFGCPRSGDSMGIPHGVSHCGHEDIPGDGPTWGYPMCPMSQVSQYLGTSQDIPGMVPHGATVRVLCLKCPSTWGHPRTSRGWSHMGLPYVSYVSSVPVLGDIPGHPEDGPTWGYPTCPMSQVSQYLGTSQDIPRMVPHGATLCVLCLKCPSTWGHPRTSSVPHGATVRVLCLKCPSTWGHPRTSNVPHGATLCVLCLKCPSTWRHPRTSRGWSLMGLPRIHSILLAGRDC